MPADPQPDAERVFDALGDPTRRRIVDRLVRGPASVTALAEPLGITLTAVAQHLKLLEESGLVVTEKVGRVRTCRLDDRGLHVISDWAERRRSTWDRRLNRLEQMFRDGRGGN